MAEGNTTTNRWLFGLAYFGLMGGLVTMVIIPVDIWPRRFPGPDLLVAITFAWVLRRPQYMPTLLVAAVFLGADILLMRPLGLWTALVVLAVEFLRAREPGTREQPFMLEWAMVTAALIAITLANRLILGAFLVGQAGLGLVLLHLSATILTYPLIVLFARWPLGIGKMTPGDTDAKGRPR